MFHANVVHKISLNTGTHLNQQDQCHRLLESLNPSFGMLHRHPFQEHPIINNRYLNCKEKCLQQFNILLQSIATNDTFNTDYVKQLVTICKNTKLGITSQDLNMSGSQTLFQFRNPRIIRK